MVETYSDSSQEPKSPISTALALRQPDGGYARSMTVASPTSGAYHNIYQTNILRLPDVMKRVGLKHASIYQRMARGTFPKQISLGDRAVGWLDYEIEAWVLARVIASRGKKEF